MINIFYFACLIKKIELYIDRDPKLVSTLQQLRRAGKKTFLLTNSQWSYADRVLAFLTQDQ